MWSNSPRRRAPPCPTQQSRRVPTPVSRAADGPAPQHGREPSIPATHPAGNRSASGLPAGPLILSATPKTATGVCRWFDGGWPTPTGWGRDLQNAWPSRMACDCQPNRQARRLTHTKRRASRFDASLLLAASAAESRPHPSLRKGWATRPTPWGTGTEVPVGQAVDWCGCLIGVWYAVQSHCPIQENRGLPPRWKPEWQASRPRHHVSPASPSDLDRTANPATTACPTGAGGRPQRGGGPIRRTGGCPHLSAHQ